MPRVFLDQAEVSGLPTDLLSVGAIIKHLEVNSMRPGTVIRQIYIDGQPVIQNTSDATKACLKTTVSDGETINVLTGTVREISRESITEAIAYLHRVETLTPSLCASFQTSPSAEAYLMLRQLYDGFYWVHLLVDRLKATFGEMVACPVEGTPPLADLTSSFRSVLRRLVQAQESEDFALMSDVLEFEMLPLVPQWRSRLQAMGEAVETCT